MQTKLMAIASLVMALSFSDTALAYGKELPMNAPPTPVPPIYIGAYQGYGVVNNMMHSDGQSAIGRLAFGLKAYSYCWDGLDGNIGVELGLQNGKTMRHTPASNDPTADVDLPIQTTLNPVLDLLVAFEMQFAPGYGYFGLLKAGMAYRQLQFTNANFVSALNQISGEVQVGLGYMVTEHTRVVAFYQGIYADGNVNYRGNGDGHVRVSNIPTQQAGFLGLEIAI